MKSTKYILFLLFGIKTSSSCMYEIFYSCVTRDEIAGPLVVDGSKSLKELSNQIKEETGDLVTRFFFAKSYSCVLGDYHCLSSVENLFRYKKIPFQKFEINNTLIINEKAKSQKEKARPQIATNNLEMPHALTKKSLHINSQILICLCVVIFGVISFFVYKNTNRETAKYYDLDGRDVNAKKGETNRITPPLKKPIR